ncbi:MAG: DUF4432 family protein [Rhodospirillales bacterium]|nr:DUF4432 family protein [Rhodospirillales bacterium]
MSALAPLVGTLRQLASVRSLTLNDGVENGVRVLAFSTGGGLDFVVLADRSLDIGLASWCGVPLAWQSPSGFRHPSLRDPLADRRTGLTGGLSGFLMTCGLDSIRRSEGDAPMHGELPVTPARLTAYGENWAASPPILFCEGEIVQGRYGGSLLKLCRRIEAEAGGSAIAIIDTVENCGPEPAPHQVLYHFNLGYPAIADGTTVASAGRRILGPLSLAAGNGPEVPQCHPAGEGEASWTVTTPSDRAGVDSLRITFKFDPVALPVMQLWGDLRAHCGVLSIEPCTSRRTPDGGSEPGRVLQPGERQRYRLEVSVAGTPPKITFNTSENRVQS